MHYDISPLTFEQRKDLLRRARQVASRWWVDKLDCRTSVFRQLVEMEFEPAVALMQPSSLFTAIHRRQENVLEIGFRASDVQQPTMIDWFVFVTVPYPEAAQLIETVGLHPLTSQLK